MMIAAQRLAAAAIAAMAAASSLPAPAAAQGFTTSTGHRVDMRDVGTMNCGDMQATIDRIDATGYRSGPTPRNASDGPLYNYEMRLAEERYQRCLRGGR